MNYTIAILGDSGVGKTTFLERHTTGRFIRDHTPTTQMTAHQLVFHTTHGVVNLRVLEFPSQTTCDEIRALIRHPCFQLDAVIIMFDRLDADRHGGDRMTGSSSSDDRLRSSTLENSAVILSQIPIGFPTVMVSNKNDIPQKSVSVRKVYRILNSLQRQDGYLWVEVSARSNYNFEKPFLYLLRKLVNDDQLNFVSVSASSPRSDI